MPNKRDLRRALARARYNLRRRVAPGWRLPTGVMLIFGGILGFLPILGFWMIPLGVALAAMDVKDIRNGKLRRRRPPPHIDGRPGQNDPDK